MQPFIVRKYKVVSRITWRDDLQCFRFCRKFEAGKLHGRLDQNKHCRSRHFVCIAQRICQTSAVSGGCSPVNWLR